MRSEKEIRDVIKEKWAATPFVDVCLRLVGALYKIEPAEAEMLTYQSVLDLLDLEELTQDVQSALMVLTTSDEAILKPGGVFIDEDDSSFDLSDAEFSAVVNDNTLVHPISGEEVLNARSRVLPYFTLALSKDEVR